jgi:hypothetical protein
MTEWIWFRMRPRLDLFRRGLSAIRISDMPAIVADLIYAVDELDPTLRLYPHWYTRLNAFKIHRRVGITSNKNINATQVGTLAELVPFVRSGRYDLRMSAAVNGPAPAPGMVGPRRLIIENAPAQRPIPVEEWRTKWSLHKRKERKPSIVKEKKHGVLAATGSLKCECCTFDFAEVFGEHGDGFIECHHTNPVAGLREGETTSLAELAIVCANCHRMIHLPHKRKFILTIADVKRLITDARENRAY